MTDPAAGPEEQEQPAKQMELDPPESRWPAIVAVLAVGGIYSALPASLAVGPRWGLPLIVCGLLIPIVITHHKKLDRANILLGHTLAGVLTLFMIGSLALLIRALPSHKESPVSLLRSGASLWLTNIVVFAFWYWRLDAGGPHGRDGRVGHPDGAFLFPQMTMDDNADPRTGQWPWSPAFVDYLFLAFNTSTAFSPTDVPVLSRWAKVMMMIQSTISLTVVAILLGRGVNIL